MTNPFGQQIQDFYDASTELWEEVWGEHLHHGYYGDSPPPPSQPTTGPD